MPRSAEARVTADPYALPLVESLMSEKGATHVDPLGSAYLSALYNLVARAAVAREDTVGIQPDRGELAPGVEAAHSYYPRSADPEKRKSTIYYRSEAPVTDLRHTFPHELFHFLNRYGPEGKPALETNEEQHAVIKMLTGADRYQPAPDFWGFRPPLDMPVEVMRVLGQWLMPRSADVTLGQPGDRGPKQVTAESQLRPPMGLQGEAY